MSSLSRNGDTNQAMAREARRKTVEARGLAGCCIPLKNPPTTTSGPPSPNKCQFSEKFGVGAFINNWGRPQPPGETRVVAGRGAGGTPPPPPPGGVCWLGGRRCLFHALPQAVENAPACVSLLAPLLQSVLQSHHGWSRHAESPCTRLMQVYYMK